MRPPEPVLVADLFPEMLDALLSLLQGLPTDDWARQTSCSRWSVKDVALHLLGGEVGILSRQRDRFQLPAGKTITEWPDLVAFINAINDTWIRAARRISPRLLCDLLRWAGAQTCDYFRSLDPYAIGEPVSWAGPGPAPVWLDVAREYTERWHHQQQIRDALRRPGLTEPRFLAPVIAAFVRALPHTYRNVVAPDGAVVTLSVTGDSGGRWSVRREGEAWLLYAGAPENPHAEVVLDQDAAWRCFCKMLSREEVRRRAQIFGDRPLAEEALKTVSVIA